MTAVADALDIARPHLSAMRHRPFSRPRGRPPLLDAELVADIRLLVADLPTYLYRRAHALLRRQARQTGRAAPNPKRVYRVMKAHGLLLQSHGGKSEKVRVAFALDYCDRETMGGTAQGSGDAKHRWKGCGGHLATTGGITAEDVRDLMVATVEHRFGHVNRLAEPIE